MRKLLNFFSKQISAESNKEKKVSEWRVKDSESNFQSLNDNHEYLSCKNKLDAIYDDIANGINVRIFCDWFEYGKKFSRFFQNLERHRATKRQIRSILYNNEITNRFSKIIKS